MTTLLDPARIFDALNGACNGLGMELSESARRRIFAAIDSPGMTTWIAARNLLVSETRTLWQAVMEFHGVPEHGEPSSFTILDALERSTK